MKKFKLFKLLALLVVLITSINTMWATDYYYRGDENSWGNTKMTASSDNLYAYCGTYSNNAHKFKIALTTTGWDYNYSYVDAGFNSTDVSNIGDFGKDNCYCWQSGSYYILIYYPNTAINTTNKPKICASTTLPSNTFTVTYNANGGSGTTASNTSVKYNTSTTLKANGFTAPSGYHFVGWNTAADYSGTTYAAGASFTVTGNVTLYAKWAKTIYVYDAASWGSLKLYTYNSEKNGGWPGNTTGVTSLGSSWYQVDILSGAANFVLNCNSSGDNNKTADQTTSGFTDGRSYYINTSTSPRGLNEKTLTVSFNMKSHGDQVSSQNVYYKGLVTEPDDPSADHYTFGGWYKESACTNKWNFSTDKVTAATTLYAKWTEITHTVSFTNDGNGSTSPNTNQTVGEVTGIAISTTPNDGKEFSAWSITSGTGSFASGTGTSSNRFYPSSDATIRASFRSNRALTVAAGTHVTTVTGSVDPVTLGTPTAIAATAFESGYEFDEWTADPEENASFANSKSSSTNVTVSNGSVTVTANAKESIRTITIVGGTTSSTTAGVVTTGSATAAAPAAGKKFTGWNIGAGVTLTGCVATDRTISFTATADATVTAQYADRAQVKMYFAKPTNLSWTKVYAYAWKSSDASVCNKAYPGVELENTEVINCVTYYTYQYYTEGDGIGGAATGNSAWNKIVFGDNNDARKTGDLNIADGHYYYRATVENTSGKSSAITSAWYIKGTMNSWDESAPITHDCANNKGTVNINLTKGTTYEFKVYNETNNQMWSNSSAHGTTPISGTMATATTLYSNDANVMKITANVTGPYTFEVSSTNAANPKVKVTFPTSYTVTYNAETFVNGGASHSTSTTGGTVSAVDGNSAALSSGGLVISGGTAVITASKKTGYSFIGFYTTAACTTPISGAGVSISDNVLTLSSISGNKTVYAKFSENMTTVNLVASPTGKGTFTCGGGAVTSVSAGVTTHPTVTAVPISGYRVNTSATVWSESSDYITISATNAASTTITGSGTSGNSATLTATFTPIVYTITLNDNEGSGGVGSATVTFDDDNFAFASSFVAPTRTGYIFQGYYTASSMDVGDQLIDKDGNWHSDTEPYVYIDGGGNWIYPNNMTLYAGWTPITFTIHYDANGGSGSIDDQVAKYEVESSLDGQNSFISTNGFTAPTGYGIYYPAHPWNTSADGTGTDIDAATYQSTLTSTNGATVNLYAQWSGRFALKANYDGGVDGYFRVHYNTAIIEALTTLYPTRLGYLCDGYYTADEDGTKVLNGDGTVIDGNVSGYVTGGKWTYKGTQDFYAHWNQIKYNLAFDGNDCAAYVGEVTGSKASMANVEYETDVDITAGTLAREGYTFAGWSKTACATSPTYVGSTTRHISSTDGDNVTLYAVWNAKNYTISFNALGGDCYTPSKTVAMGANYGSLPTAWGNSGYEFVGWYTRPEGGTLVTEETQMVTASDHTLYAHYEKKERVYFKNTLGWESVYVTWDAEWNHGGSDKGAGASGKTQELMSNIYGTDIWYKDVPAAILSSWKGNIAFTNIAMPNYEWFDDGQAVYRRDFDSDATMFVPTPNDPHKYTKNKHDAKPGTVYYSTDMIVDKDKDENVTNYRYKNGYWVRYDELQSGYTVKGSWAWDDDHYVERHSLNDSTYVFTIRNLAANTDYWFNLYKHCTTDNDYSSVFKPAADMTSASSDVVFSAQYAGGGDKKMTTTVAGDYTFKFVFSRLGEIRLTIEYPLAVNDYRVVYSYTKGGAQTFASEYIKAKADAVDTISMFIHSADSATARSLYVQKCTGISAGVPTWNTTYSAITLPSETASGKTSGVYNFRIAQNGSAAATGESIGKYDGNYYIRTDSAAGGWDFYKEYPSSQMTFSEYSLSQTLSAPYSHYYCQYVGNSSTDISYTIATDYSPAICPVMTGDATIGVGNKTLPSGKPASVRFTWNEETNATFRSYLKSAQGEGNKRFLVLHGSDNKVLDADGNTIAGEGAGAEQMHANELLFSDTENWVYELAFKAKPGAKVSIIARYNDVDRYLVGKADAWETIISGGADTKYDIAAVYDFKTNRLITTWIPSGTISDQIEEVDVLIERHNQDGATTITFGKATVDAKAGSISAKRVIGALRFDYNELVGRVSRWTEDTRAKMMFFVSFPFDVNVSDIFGLNTNYGEAFIVQGYNGAKRAEKGFFKGDGTDTFWETLPVDTVMHAGVGYVVTLDNDYFNGDVGHIWDNKRAGDHVYMYFPSANDPEDPIIINSDAKTINVPAHLCTINRTFNGGKLNHKYTDSNWNVMGVPIFQNHTGDDGIAGTPGAIFTASKEPSDTTEYADPKNPAFGYFYVWNTDKTYTIQSAVDFVFKPMHSYMVQYAGDVKFTCAEPVVPSLAPRRTAMKENYNIELQVLNNSGDMLNHTYVELRENAVDSFALNEDIYMMSSNKAVSVYTFAGTYDVAANVLSIGSHVVPVGVIVKQAGTYTFTMPSNFSGTVTLVDTYAQTRTNLNIEDYEVSLPKGTDEERFYLEININKVPTAIDGAKVGEGTLKDGKVHKFIMNDQMYILKDGLLYDARGNRVK